MSISASPEGNNLERIQQIALRFESQVYASAANKKEYYEIISNKINSIAQKKSAAAGSESITAGGSIKQQPISVTSSGNGALNMQQTSSIPRNGSYTHTNQQPFTPNRQQNIQPTANPPARNYAASGTRQASSVILNPQQLLMNTMGKLGTSTDRVNAPPQIPTGNAQNHPIGSSFVAPPNKTIFGAQVRPAISSQSTPIPEEGQLGKPPTSNPFIPQIGIGGSKQPPQLRIPSTNYSGVSTKSSPAEPLSADSKFPQAKSVQSAPISSGNYERNVKYHDVLDSPPSNERVEFSSTSTRNGPSTVNSAESYSKPFPTNMKTAENKPSPQLFNELSAQIERNRSMSSGNLPNLSLSPEEKESVQRTVDSLKMFLPKIDVLLNVSNSIGISQENLKKVVNLKNILVKQIEFFKSDVYLLSPLMAENLAEHLKKFISLLLSKINAHPAAQSIIENLKKFAPPPTPQEAEKRNIDDKPTTTTASIKQPTFSQPLMGEKKTPSPSAVIRESPFKLAQKTTEATNGNKTTDAKGTSKQGGIHKKISKPSFVHNPEANLLHRIPTLNYIKTKFSKTKKSIPIEYLKSQLEFAQECSNTIPAAAEIPVESALNTLKKHLSNLF